ncbi:MAG: hypothetical protein J2P57_00245 [Acidimicrobiaceae bacterium]|nr:hypothetical protein [Acidimicrobiaceae bacterium]
MTASVSTRAGWLAVAVGVSAGIHIGLTPEHLKEMPRLGYTFIAASVLGVAIAGALIAHPHDRRIAALAGTFCLGEILAWVLFVTIPVPFFPGTPEGVEVIAVVSKGVEAIGWVLALGLMGPAKVATPRLVGVDPVAMRRAPSPDVDGTYLGGGSDAAYVGRGVNGG